MRRMMLARPDHQLAANGWRPGRARLPQGGRKRWLEPKVRAGVANAALKAALDADDHTAAWRLLARPHWRASLSWAALSDAAGYFDIFGSRPWPGLVSAAATAEALRRRGAWKYAKSERSGRERFLWTLEPAGLIYLTFVRERSLAQLALAIGRRVDVEGLGDYCAIGLELLRERVRPRGALSPAVRRALAPALASEVAMTRELAFQVIAVAQRSRNGGAGRRA